MLGHYCSIVLLALGCLSLLPNSGTKPNTTNRRGPLHGPAREDELQDCSSGAASVARHRPQGVWECEACQHVAVAVVETAGLLGPLLALILPRPLQPAAPHSLQHRTDALGRIRHDSQVGPSGHPYRSILARPRLKRLSRCAQPSQHAPGTCVPVNHPPPSYG